MNRPTALILLAAPILPLLLFLPLSTAQQPGGLLPPPSAAPSTPPNTPDTPLKPRTNQPNTKKLAWKVDSLTAEQRRLMLAGQRGADWLQRANNPSGRFLYGFRPALSQRIEGDHYLHQVGAACALAQAARAFDEERWGAIARQALLTLLLETATDSTNPQVRYTALPSNIVNRCGSAGNLILAIHALPQPADDLLKQSEQLCMYLQHQLQSDGSLKLSDDGAQQNKLQASPISGEALQGLIASHKRQPADWKLEALRKARNYYHALWTRDRNLPMIAGHTGAYAEAFAITNERPFADTVFEFNDWLCTLQYQQVDSRLKSWEGGFRPWREGKIVTAAPDVQTALAAQSLAQAVRVARQARDFTRARRYRDALENSLQFLVKLQYSEGNTQHFASWYRPMLVGGFHAATDNGDIRLNDTALSVSALILFLQHGLDPS